ncbi:MAG: TetR/AcrR family transcriptional regulator [Gaiellaceae bacterium]
MREDGALRTRRLVTKAAQEAFEAHGWAGATVAMIAKRAGVSQSTVETVFRTKSALLKATVDYSIRGDVDPLPIRGREISKQMEAAPDPISMLELHAVHLRGIHGRSAKLAFVVEQAAKSDQGVAALWRKMNENRRDGVEWAARTLLAKPGVKHLRAADVEKTFWVALDWGNYRLLTDHAGLSAEGYQQWILDYYLRMFALKKCRSSSG